VKGQLNQLTLWGFGFLMEPHIAICFFGITRSLSHTLPSIEKNALDPARAAGTVRLYAHFFQQRALAEARSGESGAIDPDEQRLLRPDWLQLEEPDDCLAQWDFETLKRHGDFWDNGFRSLRNLVHQLHSLNLVTQAALADGARVCLFLRPDLRYHDSLGPAIARALRSAREDQNLVQLPRWQSWGGRNDRFAIVAGAKAIAAYGGRVTHMAGFCTTTGSPLHSEQLLAHALAAAGITVRPIGARASRVRLNGRERYEDFLPPPLSLLRGRLVRALGRGPSAAGDTVIR
jgi:hypothetical protein